jgi:hypothetical protein
MPLVDIELSIDESDLPSDVLAFLREAYLRVGQHVRNSPIRLSGFAPSGFATVYRSMRAIVEAKIASTPSLTSRVPSRRAINLSRSSSSYAQLSISERTNLA